MQATEGRRAQCWQKPSVKVKTEEWAFFSVIRQGRSLCNIFAGVPFYTDGEDSDNTIANTVMLSSHLSIMFLDLFWSCGGVSKRVSFLNLIQDTEDMF